jgi:hypothetical protein
MMNRSRLPRSDQETSAALTFIVALRYCRNYSTKEPQLTRKSATTLEISRQRRTSSLRISQDSVADLVGIEPRAKSAANPDEFLTHFLCQPYAPGVLLNIDRAHHPGKQDSMVTSAKAFYSSSSIAAHTAMCVQLEGLLLRSRSAPSPRASKSRHCVLRYVALLAAVLLAAVWSARAHSTLSITALDHSTLALQQTSN